MTGKPRPPTVSRYTNAQFTSPVRHKTVLFVSCLAWRCELALRQFDRRHQ